MNKTRVVPALGIGVLAGVLLAGSTSVALASNPNIVDALQSMILNVKITNDAAAPIPVAAPSVEPFRMTLVDEASNPFIKPWWVNDTGHKIVVEHVSIKCLNFNANEPMAEPMNAMMWVGEHHSWFPAQATGLWAWYGSYPTRMYLLPGEMLGFHASSVTPNQPDHCFASISGTILP